MGVQNLWDLLSPAGRRLPLEVIRGKSLAVDASVWLTQFIRAMRDSEGMMMRNAHLLGFFRRCCKLLFHYIRPVFVFDGQTPALKRRTLERRRSQHEKQAAKLRRVAEKMVLNTLRAHALDNVTAKTKPSASPTLSQTLQLTTSEPSSATSRQPEGETPSASPPSASPPSASPLPDEEVASSPLQAESSALASATDGDSALRDESRIPAWLDNLASSSSEDEGTDSTLVVPENYDDIDVEGMKALPSKVRAEIWQRMIHQKRKARREQMASAEGSSPRAFSREQIKAFVHSTSFKRDMRKVRSSLSSHKGAGERVQSDSRRTYTFHKDERKKTFAELDRMRRVEAESQETSLAASRSIGWATRALQRAETTTDQPVLPIFPSSRKLHTEKDGEVAVDQDDNEDCNDDEDDNAEDMEWEDVAVDTVTTPTTTKTAPGTTAGEIEPAVEEVLSSKKIPSSDVKKPAEVGNFSFLSAFVSGWQMAKGTDAPPTTTIVDSTSHPSVSGTADKLLPVTSVPDLPPPPLSSPHAIQDEIVPVEEEREVVDVEEGSKVRNGTESVVEEDGELQQAILRSLADSHVPLKSGNGKKVKETGGGSASEEEEGIDRVRVGVVTEEGGDLEGDEDLQRAIQLSMNTSNHNNPGKSVDTENEDAIIVSDTEGVRESALSLHVDNADSGRAPAVVGEHMRIETANIGKEGSAQKSERAVDVGVRDDGATDILRNGKGLEDVEVALEVRAEEKNSEKREDEEEEVVVIDSDEREEKEPEVSGGKLTKAGNLVSVSLADVVEVPSMLNSPEIEKVVVREKVGEAEELVEEVLAEVKDGMLPEEVAAMRERITRESETLGAELRSRRAATEVISDEMYTETRDMLQLFGIPYLEAPFEAEAQCAWLNDAGLVQGVVTEDSDAFLFGAKLVYKNLFEKNKFVEGYDMKDIEREMGLSRNKLITLALLLGSDYTDGVRGVGIVNATEILDAFPGVNGLKEFAEWTKSVTLLDKEPTVEELNSLSSQDAARKMFCWKHRNVKRNWEVREGFPNEQVIRAYAEPACDRTEAAFTWSSPNFEMLRRFCWEKFGWRKDKADEVLVPLENELERRKSVASRPQQTRIDTFFHPERFATIRSERLGKAIQSIAGEKNSSHLITPALRKSTKARKGKKTTSNGSSENETQPEKKRRKLSRTKKASS